MGSRPSQQVQRLSSELKTALDQQAATAEILRLISHSPTNIQPVFEAIAGHAARLCEAEFCAVFRFDGTFVHFAAHSGLLPDETR